MRELGFLSNEKFDFQILPSYKKLERNLRSTTIISGDGGAFKHLPRISCYKFASNRYIVNGIGEIKNDRVLVVGNKNIYQLRIN